LILRTVKQKKIGKTYLSVIRGIVPEGWRLPTFDDWLDLIEYLGVDSGAKLKSRIGWIIFLV
jgi:uncharacterized protein (TIGR02145 family)